MLGNDRNGHIFAAHRTSQRLSALERIQDGYVSAVLSNYGQLLTFALLWGRRDRWNIEVTAVTHGRVLRALNILTKRCTDTGPD
jgi:hypothetical protein